MLTAIGILLSFLIAIVIIGDGASPMGAILIYSLLAICEGNAKITAGLMGIMVGWTGVIGLLSATFLLSSNPSKQLTYQFPFCVILYLSWLGFALIGTEAERDYSTLWSSFILSTPFQITFLIVAYQFFVQRLKNNED